MIRKWHIYTEIYLSVYKGDNLRNFPLAFLQPSPFLRSSTISEGEQIISF